jgi:WD40 repeat protein
MQNRPSTFLSLITQDSTNFVSYSSSLLYDFLRTKMTKKKRFVAFAGDRENIKIWDIEENRIVKTLETSVHTSRMILLRDNSFLSVGTDVRIWDLQSCSLVSKLEGHEDHVFCVIELPGDRIATGSLDHTVRIWSIRQATCLSVLKGHSDVLSLVLLDNDHFASTSDSIIKIWNISTLECIRVINNNSSCNCLLLLPNGSLACGDVKYTIKIWDWTSGTCLSVLEAEQIVWDMDNIDENLIVSCGKYQSLIVWDVSTQQLVSCATDKRNYNCIKKLDANLVVAGLDEEICIWNSSTCHIEKSFKCNFNVCCVLVL